MCEISTSVSNERKRPCELKLQWIGQGAEFGKKQYNSRILGETEAEAQVQRISIYP